MCNETKDQKGPLLFLYMYYLTSAVKLLVYIDVSTSYSKNQNFHYLNEYIAYVIWVANHL